MKYQHQFNGLDTRDTRWQDQRIHPDLETPKELIESTYSNCDSNLQRIVEVPEGKIQYGFEYRSSGLDLFWSRIYTIVDNKLFDTSDEAELAMYKHIDERNYPYEYRVCIVNPNPTTQTIHYHRRKITTENNYTPMLVKGSEIQIGDSVHGLYNKNCNSFFHYPVKNYEPTITGTEDIDNDVYDNNATYAITRNLPVEEKVEFVWETVTEEI
jgi:hypothetical protein